MTISGEEAFPRWAAAAGPWVFWVKPSLFAPQYVVDTEPDAALPNVGWLPPAGDVGLVLDVESPTVVRMGVALHQRGYCPVPMFNTTPGWKEVFPATLLAVTLLRESSRLTARDSGPPVFLLDPRRETTFVWLNNGDYDNRWYVSPSDFPTQQTLQEAGVKKLLVVTEKLKTDLHDALARHTGLELELVDPKTERRAPFPKPRWLALRAFSGLGRTPRGDGTFGYEYRSGG